jgi:hypothetical protein
MGTNSDDGDGPQEGAEDAKRDGLIFAIFVTFCGYGLIDVFGGGGGGVG